MWVLWVVLGVVVILGAWVIAGYNRLVRSRVRIDEAWAQIDTQLQRRHDLIPNLVESVKGAMNFEKQTLEAVINARNQAIGAQASGSVAATAAAESQLSGALRQLFALVENYPQLKATTNVGQLQEELTSTENKIAFARQLYNDTATTYNYTQQSFPTNLVAGLAKATPAELWEITDSAERATPRVDLSLNS